MLTRREAREQALTLVFQMGFGDDSVADMAEAAQLCRDEETDPYAMNIANLVQEHFLEIDAIISRHSSKWRVSRLPKATAAILRLAVGEMTYLDDVPVGVAINEAVELAKKFSGDEDPAYVNGVLGGYAQELARQSAPVADEHEADA